jgi:hypothetical protein
MTGGAKRSRHLLGEDELLRIATAVPHAPPTGETSEEQVRRFLAWEGIRPGRTAGIELHLLYYLYDSWLAEHRDSPRPERIPPRLFGRILSRLGFRRKKARRRWDSRPCVAMDRASALRLKKWAKWFDLPEYRRLCKPQRCDSPDQSARITRLLKLAAS